MKILWTLLGTIFICLCFIIYKQYQTISFQKELLTLSNQITDKQNEAIGLCDEILDLYNISK